MSAVSRPTRGDRPDRVSLGMARRRVRRRICGPVRPGRPARDPPRRVLRALCDRSPGSHRAVGALDGLRPRGRRQAALAVGGRARRRVCGRHGAHGRSHRRRDHPPRRCRARRSGALARRRLRDQRRPAPVGVPHPRRLRRPGRKQAERAHRRQGRDRWDRADRIARDDGRLPPRLQRLPLGQGCQAAGRRRPVERPDTRHAEPDRRADRTRRPARVRRPAQLRHGHVPAAARLHRGPRAHVACALAGSQRILDGLVSGSRADRARGHGVREQPRRHLGGSGRARRRRHRGGDEA